MKIAIAFLLAALSISYASPIHDGNSLANLDANILQYLQGLFKNNDGDFEKKLLNLLCPHQRKKSEDGLAFLGEFLQNMNVLVHNIISLFDPKSGLQNIPTNSTSKAGDFNPDVAQKIIKAMGGLLEPTRAAICGLLNGPLGNLENELGDSDTDLKPGEGAFDPSSLLDMDN